VTLGQVATDEKSNAITAIPELLAMLDLEDAIAAIDAIGRQKEIAAQIVAGRGNYVFALR
jgi:predicted transposase YbfD/YdcC